MVHLEFDHCTLEVHAIASSDVTSLSMIALEVVQQVLHNDMTRHYWKYVTNTFFFLFLSFRFLISSGFVLLYKKISCHFVFVSDLTFILFIAILFCFRSFFKWNFFFNLIPRHCIGYELDFVIFFYIVISVPWLSLRVWNDN